MSARAAAVALSRLGPLAAALRSAEALAGRLCRRLREDRETLLEAQHIAGLGNWSYDCATRRLEWSDELFRILGCDPHVRAAGYAEALRRVHPEDRRRFHALMRASLLEGQGYETDVRVRTFDGSTRWLQVLGLPMVNEAARVVLVRGTAMDITERKRAALRNTAEHGVIRLLAGAGTLAEVMPRLIETVCATFGWACGLHWMRNGAHGMHACAPGWSIGEPAVEAFVVSRHGAGARHAPRLDCGVRASSIADAGGWRHAGFTELARRAGLRTAYAVPIVAGEELLGGLELFGRDEDELDAELAAALGAIGAQIGQFCRRIEAERSLRLSEERLHGIVHSAAEAIVALDDSERVVLFNPAAERMFGWQAAEVLGTHFERFVPERLRALHGKHMHAFRDSADTERRTSDYGLSCALRRDGEEFPVEASISKVVQGAEALYTVILTDVTERQRSEARLQFLANYDPLTALPNRNQFNRLLRRALRRAERSGRRLAVLFIDLDRFEIVNEAFGHGAGDAVLRDAAARFAGCLGRGEAVARLPGDEFAVLIEQPGGLRDVATVADKLLGAARAPFELKAQECRVTASIGISTYPDDGLDAQTLLKHASIAMRRAKEHGRNHFQFYSASMNVDSIERLALEANLRRALERDEFLLHYQPQMELASGAITGVEALVRWRRPGGAMVVPGEFIPVAEESGLIAPIGQWVLRTACARSRAWEETGLPPVRVAVNLSARQFEQASIAREVAEVLEATGLQAPALELEITESTVMGNPEHAVGILRRLKDMGVRLAIDDFGTGYSSLAYLKRFPIDCIKVDRSFVQDLPGSADDAAIARAIIAMGRTLRLKVVAEGVETAAQLDFLREHGCDAMQGYYFSPPLDEEGLVALRRRGREAAARPS